MDKKGPEKKQRLLAALDQGMVMMHLDARRPGVLVPIPLRGESHLRLNLSYRFDPPDLAVGEWGVRCTLSFSGARFTVAIPWNALFGITSHVSKEFWMYPDDMPPEVFQGAPAGGTASAARLSEAEDEEAPVRPAALLREVLPEPADASSEPSPDEPKPRARGHLRIVK